MESTLRWLNGFFTAVAAFVGLVVAASSESQQFYIGGLLLFVIAVLKIFWDIKRYYDAVDRGEIKE